LVAAVTHSAWGADDRQVIPHAQDKPPGPALSPEEALAKMTVPEGFSVELVASEPDIVNPVAMTFDERGRIWITESLEYPRREAGPGRDRVKVLEDTDGDGRADRFTVFAEGLNIPSGIAVGHGGVWVANSPDLLFLEDTDGDGRADRQEVVLTGFGREDTHELPNSLTWGPDGWLYGINGVFNRSHVEYRGKTYDFTCALFRIHPRTREFEVFAEGTSNPWGVAWDNEGSAFFSACVIDHLWHIAESGYYHRQGGPYPPFTWKIGSIVEHRHQKAAYCGIHFFDSEAYPPEYRERLYMGNIHGGCVNVDALQRRGSTYFATPREDFLTANDAWFMPVVQKTGPDGCLYVLDWYDRYHCYQDANRDPEGIDRLKGRLYRVRYQDTPRRYGFDLARAGDDELLEFLGSGNVYDRDIAQRLLAERATADSRRKLQALVLESGGDGTRKQRMHALFALVGGGALDAAFHLQLLRHEDAGFRAWGVRAAGNQRSVDPLVRDRVAELADDPSPDVLLQVATAARKIEGLDPFPLLLQVLTNAGDDPLIPHVVWQNLHPLLEEQSGQMIDWLSALDPALVPRLPEMMPYLIERILALRDDDPAPVANLFTILRAQADGNAEPARQCLAMLAARSQSGELDGDRLAALRERLQPALAEILAESNGPLFLDAALVAATWRDPAGLRAVQAAFASPDHPAELRLKALEALVAAGDQSLLEGLRTVLANRDSGSVEWRGGVLASLGRLEDPNVADVVVFAYPVMEPELRPRAIELLTQRGSWAKRLLAAIGEEKIPSEALNVNQVRKLLAADNAELVEQVRAVWGTLRTDRDPAREQLVAEMRRFVRANPGDAAAGVAVYKRVCGQCHKMHGEGAEVGPDITVNGRSSFDQLLSNVFDPSLVIGASYQARTIETTDGRALVGLLVEDGEQRVVLKVQGGKLETIARDDIAEYEISRLSMMPEGVEKQLTPMELSDSFAYITLDKPPSDPESRQLPGVREIVPRETEEPAEFNLLLSEVAPQFSVAASGELGVGLLAEHLGRHTVVRTHPINEETPCVLRATIDVPAERKARLLVSVAHDANGDWQLVVVANGRQLVERTIGPDTTEAGWVDLDVDLSEYAGQSVELELRNQPNGWAWEYGYWGRAEVVLE
jgi:putative membrane-bound dehydrogenase-like protein